MQEQIKGFVIAATHVAPKVGYSDANIDAGCAAHLISTTAPHTASHFSLVERDYTPYDSGPTAGLAA